MTFFTATDNVDAWNYLKEEIDTNGYIQRIEKGSFEKESVWRKQLPFVAIEIQEPCNFLYLPKEVTLGMIEKYYLDYIINPEKVPNEDYSYGERIMLQLEKAIEILSHGGTNQCSITISQPSDIHLRYPPCLREITFKPVEGRLNMTSFWRSNDIGEAFLINQGGLAMLLRDVADGVGLKVGHHYYVSDGAHIYVR